MGQSDRARLSRRSRSCRRIRSADCRKASRSSAATARACWTISSPTRPAMLDLRLMANGEELARANPLRVVTAAPLRRYWGDLHGQSGETIGMGSAESYFRYARDVAFIDMVGHQGNDFQITDAFWAELNRLTAEFDVPGRFVCLPGYEWSGNTGMGGDRNIFYPPRRPPDPALVAHPGRRADLEQMPSTPRTSCSVRLQARTPWSSRMSAGATRISNMPMTGGSSAAWRCTRPGAPSNGSCTTPSRRATASASCATATITRDAPARPARARRPSARSAASPATSCRN